MSTTTTPTIPAGVDVNCACGHASDIEHFTNSPLTGPLPRGHYQCPACSRAWAIRTGPARIGWSGMVIPGKVSIVAIAPVLAPRPSPSSP